MTDKDKQYFLFAGLCYYPYGGADDFRAKGTMRELQKLHKDNVEEWTNGDNSTWAHICDCETMKIVSVHEKAEEWHFFENWDDTLI